MITLDSPPQDSKYRCHLNAARTEYKTLLECDVPAFNRAIGGAMTPLTGGRED
jgi:hypothetical protein